jgi:hypothetical protein
MRDGDYIYSRLRMGMDCRPWNEIRSESLSVKRPRVFSYTREHPAHASLVSNSKEPDFMKWFMLAVLIVGVALALFVVLQTVK